MRRKVGQFLDLVIHAKIKKEALKGSKVLFGFRVSKKGVLIGRANITFFLSLINTNIVKALLFLLPLVASRPKATHKFINDLFCQYPYILKR